MTKRQVNLKQPNPKLDELKRRLFEKVREAEAAHKNAVMEFGYESEEANMAHIALCVLHQLLDDMRLDWEYELFKNEEEYAEGMA